MFCDEIRKHFRQPFRIGVLLFRFVLLRLQIEVLHNTGTFKVQIRVIAIDNNTIA